MALSFIFFFQKNGDLVNISRKQVDKTVFPQRFELLLAVNVFRRNCPSRFFSHKKNVFEATSGGPYVDRTVSVNDNTCYWQSICSREIVHRASFLTGESVFEATSGGR